MPPSQHECGTLRGSESVCVCRGDRVTAQASFCCRRFSFLFLPAPPYPFEPPLACRSDLWPSSLHRPPPPQPSNALPVSGNLQRLCLPRWHLSYLFTSGPDTGAWGQSIPPLPTPALPSYSASVLWTPCPAPVPGLCTQLPKAPGLNVKPSHAWLPH